jgi:hypothetical protein
MRRLHLTEDDTQKVVLVSGNRGGDIVHLMCPNGYSVSEAHSSTGANVVTTPVIHDASMVLVEGKPNNLTVTCKQ